MLDLNLFSVLIIIIITTISNVLGTNPKQFKCTYLDNLQSTDCRFMFEKNGPDFISGVLVLILIAINFLHVFFEIFCSFGTFRAVFWDPPFIMLPSGSSTFHGG